MFRLVSIPCLLGIVFQLAGCYSPTVKSIPIITDNQGWQLEEICGSENCYPLVDVLRKDGFVIRVEARNGTIIPDVFTVSVAFSITLGFPEIVNKGYTYEPSKSFVRFGDGHTIHAKGFPCPHTRYSLSYFRNFESVNNSVELPASHPKTGKPYSCFILFFDDKPPSVEETFELHIDGLSQANKEVEVPTLFFSKGIRR